MQGKFDAVEGDFLAPHRRSEELERERLLQPEVVNAMQGCFVVLPLPESESVVSRLEGLASRFWELEKESFYRRICLTFAIIMSH